MSPTLPTFSLLILLFSLSSARHLPNTTTTTSPPSDLISDDSTQLIKLFTEPKVCEETYGFLPCTTTVLGNLFLILGYGYLMFLAATYLSSGSELLLEILGPGIVGGLFLPILGALPDAMLILVSGMSGTVETAQVQVSVGMGLLAGSTVMLLTVIWGTCIVVGKCDIEDSVAIDGKDTKGLSLTDFDRMAEMNIDMKLNTVVSFVMLFYYWLLKSQYYTDLFGYWIILIGSGVTTDIWTSYAAMIMAISLIPFIVVQLPQILHSTSGRHLAVLIALIISVLLLISYCLYQVFQPWIQRRRIDYAKHKHVISGVLKHLKMRALGRLLTDQGEPNREVIEKLFTAIDTDHDAYLSASELRALIVGIRFDEINLDEENAAAKLLKDFDSSLDEKIDLEEFIRGIKNWLDEAMGLKSSPHDGAGGETIKHLTRYHEQTKRDHFLLGDQSDEVVEGVENPQWTTLKAVLLLLLGAVIAAAFADPLVDAVDNFSSATSIPSFFISFIALPFATNSSEAVSAIIFASRKKLRSASLTFSELYGAATMNNILCLSVFLALVYARGLVWDFSSEVLVILIVCIVMGALGSVRTTFPLWTSSIAFLLYPFSLALVYILDYMFGWS